VVLVALASPAGADSGLSADRVPNKARALAEKGRTYHEAGDYEAAVAAFKEAYVLAPSPGLLFNIAQAYRLAGNCDDASWMYRRFLDTNPFGSQRKLAEQHLASVEKCSTGTFRVAAPTPPKLDAKPPDPKLEIRREDKADQRSDRFKKIGVIAGVTGVAALATAAVFAVDAKNASDTVEATYRQGGRWADIADIDARGKRDATIAAAFGIGGGVIAASGVVLFMLGRHYESAQHIAVAPGARGGQVSLHWGF
jgi:tetratricopeptide (TPR) repeat protein